MRQSHVNRKLLLKNKNIRSLCFNGHSLGVSRYQNVSILDFIGVKDDGDRGDNWSYDMQSSSQIVTTDKSTPSSFCRPDDLPVAKPTVNKK